MNLREVEERLAYYRTTLGIRLIKTEKNSLQSPVIEKIEKGENYNLASLFRYIQAIGLELEINNTKVVSTEELGRFLKEKREGAGQTFADIRWGTRRGYREIVKIETGGGSRMNLWNYLNKLNYKIDFKLIDKYGIAKERDKDYKRG